MKDKIKEVIRNTMPSYTNETETAQAILDLIAKELLKEKPHDEKCDVNVFCGTEPCNCGADIHNIMVKDIKHKLGVEDYEPFKIGKIIKKNC